MHSLWRIILPSAWVNALAIHQRSFTQIKPIGFGSFGVVVSAVSSNQTCVAIKKVTHTLTDPSIAQRFYREFMLLSTLRHENILSLIDIYVDPVNNYYLVTDLLRTDLQRLLANQSLQPSYIQCFFYQICRALKYIHSAGVVHRDLKPSNILINENCDLKICDFGSARVQNDQMTGYISTRYYRAPEVMLSWTKYDTAVDIWSLGCIFAEMYERTPLFPGQDHIDQFVKIVKLLGFPEDNVLAQVSQGTRKFLDSLPKPDQIPNFEERFACIDDLGIDLLRELLKWNPKTRLTAERILSHPYLKGLHDDTDEPIANFIFDWSSIEQEQDLDTWKFRINQKIKEFKNASREE